MSEYSAKVNILNEIVLILERYNIEITILNGQICIKDNGCWSNPIVFDNLNSLTDYYKFKGISDE